MRTPTHALPMCILLAATVLPGCVSQQEYDNVADTNTTYQSRLEELHQENRSLQNTLERKQQRIDSLEAEVASLNASSSALNREITDIRDQQANLRNRLGNLKLTMLDPALDRALRDLARSNPNLIAYDSSLGMVRFTSDLTFASGSDVVKPEAKEGLHKLAEILLASSAPYEVQVVGHTDNQKISNPATRRNHPTNRHLSVHRAIAVSEALQSFGVPGAQVLVAGWGAMHPAVPNRPKGGTPENRRVEIFLVGAPDQSPGNTGDESTADAPTDSEFPMK